MEDLTQRAQILTEALPYIRQFFGRKIVIKYGGAAMVEEHLKEAVIADIVLLHYVGMRPIVVHGGGPEVSALMKRLGKEPEFVRGLRVTDAETMEIAEMVLSGRINKDIVSRLNRLGGRAVGLSGKDANLILVERLREHQGEPVDLGYVGVVQEIHSELLELLVREGYIPVISSLGVDRAGLSYNINADHVAGQLAAAVEAAKLLLLTDVRGILADPKDPDSLLSTLTVPEVCQLLTSGAISAGMIPKVEGCLYALEGGVERVHIIDGRIPHALLMEIFTDRGIGTMITVERREV